MSSSNQTLRYDSGISKDLVLYLNTKIKLNPIKQRDFSLFLFISHQMEIVSSHVFRKLLTYLSVWSKLW